MDPIDLKKYEVLTLEELQEIATEAGIRFTIGNENIKEKKEFLDVFDEADPNELEMSYKRIILKRK